MSIEQNEPLYAASSLSMPPPTIQIRGNDSRVLLTIKPDGTVEGEVADASEAARVFCDSIPHSLKDEQRRLGIIEGLEMAGKELEKLIAAKNAEIVGPYDRPKEELRAQAASLCTARSVIRALIEEQKP